MKVVELSRTPAGAFAGLVLASLGEEVRRFDLGSLRAGPRGGEDARDEAERCFLMQGRQSESLKLPQERARLLEAVAVSDVVIEDLGPGRASNLGLSWRAAQEANPRIVVVSLSPYGASGPHRLWRASERTMQAAGGVMHATGWHGEPPTKLPGNAVQYILGLQGATAAEAAVYGVQSGNEEGVYIDISAQESLLLHWSRHVSQYAHSGTLMRRPLPDAHGPNWPLTNEASDGWLYMLALRRSWEEVSEFLGLGDLVNEETRDPTRRAEKIPQMIPRFRDTVRSRSKYDWFGRAAERGYTYAPIETPAEVLESPQMAARGFFESADLDGEEVKVPGLPFDW